MTYMPFHIVSPSDQVAAHLREQLLKNRWAHELPGTPTLAAELGIDRKTVIAALNLLEEEGLLKSQGVGRPRRITVLKKKKSNALKISIIPYDEEVQEIPYILNLIHRLKEKGHNATIASKTLLELNMDVGKIARFIENEPADLWIPLAASLPVLEWFVEQDIPAFAFFGRRRELNMGSIGPDKASAVIQATRRLIELGHRRISYFARVERRKPQPGNIESHFLSELESQGIMNPLSPALRSDPMALSGASRRKQITSSVANTGKRPGTLFGSSMWSCASSRRITSARNSSQRSTASTQTSRVPQSQVHPGW